MLHWGPVRLLSHVRTPPDFSFFLITILLIVCCHLKCEARDSINASNPLSYGETIVSAGNRFELGFFSPEGNESRRYVGIWYYKLIPRTVVWVANRNDPLLDPCGSFGIKDDGNVGTWCGNEEIVPTSNRTLYLLDSGNLILVEGQSGSDSRLWQSFDYPTDTLLPGMKLNDTVKLTSWISPTDPGIGDFTFWQDQGLYVIQNRSVVYWKSGEPGPFKTNDGLPRQVIQLLSGLEQKNNPSQVSTTRDRQIPLPNVTSLSYGISRLVMEVSGSIFYYYYYSNEGGGWVITWLEPQDYCSTYKSCGKFGICNMETSPVCRCPTGFKPVSSEDWLAGHYSEGCDRESTKCSGTGKFLNISLVNVGGQVTSFDQAKSERDCMEECLRHCDCEAYLFGNHRESRSANSAPECWIWTNDLVNLHQDDSYGGSNIFIRVPSLTTALVDAGDDTKAPKNKSRKSYVIVIIVIPAVVAGVILLSCFICILYKRRMAKQPENRERTGAPPALFSNDSERRVNDLMQENGKRIDVPFYKLDVILSATDNFSDVNKLGQGGFGPVYKGMFPGGHEIAVKRLSSFSAQGIDEFLNEVVLIAKLQHRNLVRLLGYCIKGNEKILLYEYMPNRSLDAFIFDQHKCLLLDWKKRFEIILGIARGLLYLHQDSRLRIIHRDLKTSNILLDEDMNPKISDFGLARIVEGKGTEASTNKVVGTYGYMSPEYALDGKFSVKSDVFSFGVVMLEIISGKKNTGFYNPHKVLNLLGYAWSMWCDDKALDLIDPTLLEPSDESQVMRCINIGLLCVQEDPGERPPMSTVVIMLGSESTTPLPVPTQPAFVVRRGNSTTSSSSSTKQGTQRSLSHNEMTISQVKGR